MFSQNTAELYYNTVLSNHYAGNASVVQLLIEQGAEIDFQYNETHSTLSPLHYAAMEGNAINNSKILSYFRALIENVKSNIIGRCNKQTESGLLNSRRSARNWKKYPTRCWSRACRIVEVPLYYCLLTNVK